MSNRGRGRTWTDFPDSYFRILEHFEKQDKSLVLTFTFRECMARRKDLYLFKYSLGTAATENHHARELSRLIKRLTMRIVPATSKDPEIEATLIIEVNAIELRFGTQLDTQLSKTEVPKESIRRFVAEQAEDIPPAEDNLNAGKLIEVPEDAEGYDIAAMERLLANRKK